VNGRENGKVAGRESIVRKGKDRKMTRQQQVLNRTSNKTRRMTNNRHEADFAVGGRIGDKACETIDRRKCLGSAGEAAAAWYLEKKGWKILERNYRCRLGEIDLIALDGNVLVFVEVRSRSSASFGVPQESVGYKKQNKVRSVARYYMMGKKVKYQFSGCRFDVLAVKFNKESGKTESIEHIENAF